MNVYILAIPLILVAFFLAIEVIVWTMEKINRKGGG